MFDAGKITIAPWQSEADAINELLEIRYHKDQIRNKARFRISWTTNQTERRFGNYHVFLGNIFLREERGELEVPKYPDFPDCWMLEEFIYAPIQEIAETKNGHYEIVYPFLSQDGKPLEPLFRVCEIIIYARQHPHNPQELLNYLTEKDKKLLEREIAYFKDKLDDENGSWLWVDKKAVVTVPRNYERPEKVIIPGVISSTKGEI